MYGICLQDFVTIRGATSVTSITQSEAQWLDLQAFQDLVFWLDVKELTSGGATTFTVAYQTAPTKDDSLFVNMASVTIAAGVAVTSVLKDTATNPLARYVRWQLAVTGSPTSAWDATFRIWVAGNAPGARAGAMARGAVASGSLPTDPGTPSVPLQAQPGGIGVVGVPSLSTGGVATAPGANTFFTAGAGQRRGIGYIPGSPSGTKPIP